MGDNNTAPPEGILEYKGKAKWNAWNSHRGKPKELAQH
jgi:acyl-CoA-binding protein